MRYFFDSIITWSYWRYALFSGEAIGKFFATLGVLYLCVEITDMFNIYTKDKYSYYGAIFLVSLSLAYVLTTRRPVSRVVYKVPKKDISFEVRIGDIFSIGGETIISSNTTFDTSINNGLIATDSLQGQLALRYFGGNTDEIDHQIEKSIEGVEYIVNDSRPGKKREYPIGTTARISSHGRNFYLVAMSQMGVDGNAISDVRMIDDALAKLWANLIAKAEHGDIVIPLMGTGRGRIPLPRKKVVEKIAQSFADASHERVFSNRLIIMVHPRDAERFSLNLFQVRDYLIQSLQV